MGWEAVKNVKTINFSNFSAGWFPGKKMNDIPGSLTNGDEPLGMEDGNAVIWQDGALRKLYGWDNINSSALNSGATITSLFYSSVLNEFVCTAGDKLFNNTNTSTPDDITGTATFSAGLQVSWDQWQFETTKYIVGCDGTNTPVKWTGTGTAAVLGGSPPTGRWVKVWQNAIWLANTPTEPSTIFFSNLGDGETWTTNDDYKFDAPITGLGTLGNLLVVFKSDSIGVLSGSNNRVLTKVDKFITGVGCSGGHTIVNCKLQGQEVLVFHAHDGIYAFDGSPTLIKLSNPIQQKYTSSSSTTRWNDARFSNAWATYSNSNNWYMLCLSDGGDSKNDFMVILDLTKVLSSNEGLYTPHWPVDAIDSNCILAVPDAQERIYFGDTAGFIMRFTPGTYNQNGSSYDGYFQSGTMDTVNTWVLQEVNIIGDQQSSDIVVSINADLETGDGESGTGDFTDSVSGLDSFILDTDTLGGKEFIFSNIGINHFGRFVRFKISNDDLNEGPVIQQLQIIVVDLGRRSNVS